ncbi:MAG: hypothetical protein RL632_1336 [Bacteroidota bacterium]|jgi:hypothetical protein
MRLLIFIVTFLNIASIFGQKNGLYFIDSLNNTPIENVRVKTSSEGIILFTDQDGFVPLKNLNSSDSIHVFRIGYIPKVISAKHFNTSTTFRIYLSPNISSLSEVMVNASQNNSIFKDISELDIQLRPITNSQDVLRMVPGLFIGQHAGGGKAEQIFLRGFDLDHGTDIQLSVDGMPVNMVSHAHGQGYADLHFVIPELIQNVNFNKGPYFAEKGNFTTAGFVEFKIKDYLKKNFIKTEGGQFNTFRSVFGINLLGDQHRTKNQSLYIAGEAFYTKGYFDNPQNFNRFNGLIKYHDKLNENTSLTASISGFYSKWNASEQIPERAVSSGLVGFYGAIDNKEGGGTARYNANLELLSRIGKNATLRNQLFYTNNAFELYSNFTFFKFDSINGDQIRQKENRNIFGYNGTFSFDVKIGGIQSKINVGSQIRFDAVNNLELIRTKDRTITTKQLMFGNVRELNSGFFYSQKFAFNSRFDITTGLRFDVFNNTYDNALDSTLQHAQSAIFCPKLNLNYRINDHINLYVFNGKGFHSNDTRVAVLEKGKKVVPPAYGSDLGGVFKLGKKLYFQTAFWFLWLDQEFIYVGDEGVVEAGGRTRRYGYDLSIRHEIAKNLFLDFDLSLANPRALGVPKPQSNLPLAPKFTSIGGITYKNQHGISGSLRYRYMANRPANEDNTVVAKGYFILDATLNYSKKTWEIGMSIQNILNTKWKETQFDTESKLKNENAPVSEIHFTPGTPFSLRAYLTIYF